MRAISDQNFKNLQNPLQITSTRPEVEYKSTQILSRLKKKKVENNDSNYFYFITERNKI